MKAIGSSNENYVVHIRGRFKPVQMNAEKGKKLDDYLVAGETKDFVHLTDIEGVESTVRTSSIERIEKVRSLVTAYKTVQELHLPQLVKDDYQERVWR